MNYSPLSWLYETPQSSFTTGKSISKIKGQEISDYFSSLGFHYKTFLARWGGSFCLVQNGGPQCGQQL